MVRRKVTEVVLIRDLNDISRNKSPLFGRKQTDAGEAWHLSIQKLSHPTQLREGTSGASFNEKQRGAKHNSTLISRTEGDPSKLGKRVLQGDPKIGAARRGLGPNRVS